MVMSRLNFSVTIYMSAVSEHLLTGAFSYVLGFVLISAGVTIFPPLL